MRIAGVFAILAIASGQASGSWNPDPVASYGQQLSIRLWGEAAGWDMYLARVAIHDENRRMQSDSWDGSIGEGALDQALGGGFEVAYGVFPDVKFHLALEGAGASAQGTFRGKGSRMVIDPVQGLWRERVDRLSRYSLFGLEAGATVLLREFGWCRIGLTGRAGWHELAGASEQGEESGPFRNFWWSRKLSGSAPGVMAGVEWEWFPSRSVPLSGFLLLGYRMLVISDVSFNYID